MIESISAKFVKLVATSLHGFLAEAALKSSDSLARRSLPALQNDCGNFAS